MPEEFNTHPSPEVEEHVNGDGDGQEQTVEAQAGCAGAALGKLSSTEAEYSSPPRETRGTRTVSVGRDRNILLSHPPPATLASSKVDGV